MSKTIKYNLFKDNLFRFGIKKIKEKFTDLNSFFKNVRSAKILLNSYDHYSILFTPAKSQTCREKFFEAVSKNQPIDNIADYPKFLFKTNFTNFPGHVNYHEENHDNIGVYSISTYLGHVHNLYYKNEFEPFKAKLTYYDEINHKLNINNIDFSEYVTIYNKVPIITNVYCSFKVSELNISRTCPNDKQISELIQGMNEYEQGEETELADDYFKKYRKVNTPVFKYKHSDCRVIVTQNELIDLINLYSTPYNDGDEVLKIPKNVDKLIIFFGLICIYFDFDLFSYDKLFYSGNILPIQALQPIFDLIIIRNKSNIVFEQLERTYILRTYVYEYLLNFPNREKQIIYNLVDTAINTVIGSNVFA